MTLFSALQTAQNSLFALTRQTVVTTNNISNADNANYATRDVQSVSGLGGPQIYTVSRAQEPTLFKLSLSAYSSASGNQALAKGVSEIRLAVNGNDNETSPATKMSAIRDAIQLYSSNPSNSGLANGVIGAANDFVRTLNNASNEIQNTRAEIDSQISSAVSSLDTLLGEFKIANDNVIEGTRLNKDVNDDLDRRDQLQREIAGLIPVRALQRDDNDIVLYTEQGITLFETEPREIQLTAKAAYAPGDVGNALSIDGVPVSGHANAGLLGGLLELRDSVLVTMQSQNDEIARAVISSFGEIDSSGAGPNLAGLFAFSGGPALPADGAISNGISATIRVNAAFDPGQGGDPSLLRDGGANGAAYVANASGGSGYTDQLLSFIDRLEAPSNFDVSSGLSDSSTAMSYAAESIGWLEGVRSRATSTSESKSSLYQTISTEYLSATGVSIDAEMSKLIALEQSFQASAQVMRVVDEMFENLLATVR